MHDDTLSLIRILIAFFLIFHNSLLVHIVKKKNEYPLIRKTWFVPFVLDGIALKYSKHIHYFIRCIIASHFQVANRIAVIIACLLYTSDAADE